MDIYEKAVKLVEQNKGKISIASKVVVNDMEDLSIAYTPGVARPSKLIHENKRLVYQYTSKGNLVAVVSDGTAVLGLGNMGPEAALVVMEGKAILMKAFADIDAFPVCLATTDVEEIIKTVKNLAPTFGGINLEDISAPRCFQVEDKLTRILDIPVFHDDQHGTAIVVAAALLNALKVTKKSKDIKIVINGAGAAGIATTNLLQKMGLLNIILCDTKGPIFKGRKLGMNSYKEEISTRTNGEMVTHINDALKQADVFIGLSTANFLNEQMVKSMKTDPIIFALANPIPEIMPESAKAAGAKVVGTGRMDYPNQINNLLAFPGVLRGALDSRASKINWEMKIAAVRAIAEMINEEQLHEDYIVPSPLDRMVAQNVASAVYKAAIETGVARI
ncbi:MAG: malic enzyme-like NAD(P)-binding protein [Dehalobacterium sp.]